MRIDGLLIDYNDLMMEVDGLEMRIDDVVMNHNDLIISGIAVDGYYWLMWYVRCCWRLSGC